MAAGCRACWLISSNNWSAWARYRIDDTDPPEGTPTGSKATEGDDTPDWVVPVECKSGGAEPGHAVKQLQAGTTAADVMIPAGCDAVRRVMT